MTKPIPRTGAAARKPKPKRSSRWRENFLNRLAETSNVSASADHAGVHTSQVYAERRGNPVFARRWLEALCEGYDNLEMDLLCRLRSGESKDNSGNKFEFATAYRLLIAHRESVARERALRDNRDEQAVLDSIDAMIDEMRKRAAANAGLPGQDQSESDHERE